MILDIEPTTVLEAQLQEALHTRNMTMEAQKEVMAGMQAQTVLQSMWTKPKIPTMQKALCKPMVADYNTEDSGSEEKNKEDEDNDNDGDIQMADGDSDSN
jgi:hypothetical protein